MPTDSIKSSGSVHQSLKTNTDGSIDTSNERSPNSSYVTAVESLYQVKLLQAVRSGDPALIHPFLAEIGKDRRKSAEPSLHGGNATNGMDTGAAALHLAVRCASADTVALLLSHRAISPNGIHPPGSGTTALHLAASIGRIDILNLLLEQDGINDTLRDASGRTCRDVAKGKEVVKAIEDSHSFLNASYRSLLRSYILSPTNTPPSPALVALLESPRIRFVNLSYLDDGSGNALLHEAARRKDLRLIELAVRAGADVFVRNRKGKMAGEGSGSKDDRAKVFLRQFANHDTTLIEPPAVIAESPTLKGYLNKYTNVAKGYNTRWFVLKNGILSYYRHQEDETVASRGSISMKTATLKHSSSDRLRFEVHAAHTHGHGSGSAQKWYMKANHPVEASRWTSAITKSIEWTRREEGETSAKEGRRKSGESDSSAMRSVRSSHVPANETSTHRFSGTLLRRGGAKSMPGANTSISGSRLDVGETPAGDASPDLASGAWAQGGFPKGVVAGEFDDGGDDADVDDVPGEGESSSGDSGTRVPPYEASFELQGNSVTAQTELTSQLLSNLTTGSDVARETEIKEALKESFAVVNGLLHEYVDMARTRETWWRRQLEQERKQQKFWEESLATVVREGETLERELRVRSRRRGSKFFDASEGTLKQRPSAFGTPSGRMVKEEPAGAEDLTDNEVQTPRPLQPSETTSSIRKTPKKTSTQDTVESAATVTTIAPTPSHAVPATSPSSYFPTATLRAPLSSSKFSEPAPEEEGDTDDEDEFFDAIESGTLPNLIVPDDLASSSSSSAVVLPGMTDLAPYEGYRNLRLQLDLNEERPSTSLWSVLKHSIGKDLTKISFPVFFNEPTSMLQRMAEDMEFSECLDAAAKEKDPLRRIAFVAAFAMSNYSSTIGRIAKPFNPMLSETFEYVRFDKQYRYVSEQVSHHPPISACWAESPLWHYFGEVDAQNKFMGKSFEIRPTGIAHAELIIPAERGGPGYPKAPAKYGDGKVVEHYSWKKVTTNVSGFILGSPTIDHYGDMIVTNHRTGDQCILTFKPRGWRGKDAFEIAGQVLDASGRIAYQVAGRWNSQLIASPAGIDDVLNPDLEVDGSFSSSSGPHILLWRNSEKPVGSPFNLTPFAITLNDCPERTLLPYICPTDCRLRPDQRAFEVGKWELANELKMDQEQKQRVIRKAREDGRMEPHRPRWFTAETDGDTGERVWAPSRVGDDLEYWVERERVFKSGGMKKVKWKDVDDIFIEAPESIKRK